MYYSFVLIAYRIAEIHRNLLARVDRIFLCMNPEDCDDLATVLSDRMHPKPSFTLFCKQICDLEVIQLDFKFVSCFLQHNQQPGETSGKDHSTEPYH